MTESKLRAKLTVYKPGQLTVRDIAYLNEWLRKTAEDLLHPERLNPKVFVARLYD